MQGAVYQHGSDTETGVPELMEPKPYVRHVHYYETDQMAIVHHSNYIRWFEEARLDYLNQLGLNYNAMEAQGIIIPVTDVSCKYLISARYDDILEIIPIPTHYTGVRLAFRYEVRNQSTGALCATGTSTHCFLDTQRRPISLKRNAPQLHQQFTELVSGI